MNTKIRRVKITAEEFSPKVLKSSLFTQGMTYPVGYKLNKRYIYDYEIEFFLESSGAMFIDDKLYPIHKGDIVFRKPGQTTQGIMPYCCYLICFDLLGNTHKDPETYDFDREQEFQNYYLNPVLDCIPPLFHPASGEKYHHLFDAVLKKFINPGEGSPLLLKAHVLQILYHLHEDIRNPLMNTGMPLSPHYMTLKKVVEYAQKNIQDKINLQKLAELAGLSPNHFHKIFSETMGITPNNFITKLRLDKAKELLVKTNQPISEVALECGFENIPYFSFLFKKHLNISPGEFRRKHSSI
ncbi:helix-turn-helix transcriptional regulator [Petroclostridium xylanilyticum]|jgi:AraC-like DNA-binding protein|uniref:helix-turn-helix transcriptional regulator n=1 Tax=Petroclostridium xylanilyticum TaxID=1792311 RepID=UPI000B987114|nr:helix-turn-helix transcriptional regulator [Petroclostridium xylanilyticum]